jgi:hypothetical protein
VDMVMLATYADHDVEEEPVLVLSCGHIVGWISLDQIMGLEHVYHMEMPSGEAHPTPLPETQNLGAEQENGTPMQPRLVQVHIDKF